MQREARPVDVLCESMIRFMFEFDLLEQFRGRIPCIMATMQSHRHGADLFFDLALRFLIECDAVRKFRYYRRTERRHEQNANTMSTWHDSNSDVETMSEGEETSDDENRTEDFCTPFIEHHYIYPS